MVTSYYTTSITSTFNAEGYNCEKCKHMKIRKGFGKYKLIYYCNHKNSSGILNEEYLPHPSWCPLWKKHIHNLVDEAFNKQE